jgi:methylmalonyl-CoA/ethylmalonyl-CoA epimerase
LHHVSLQVDDIDKEVAQLKAKGVRLIGEKPMKPSEGSRVIFVHPSSTGGILIELMERS